MMTDPVASIRRRFAPLLAEAEAALQRREAQYPALVDNGKIAACTAEAEIRAWRAIACDWRNVVDATGQFGTEAATAEKIAALDESVRRYDRALAKAIQRASVAVQRDCTDGQPLWRLQDRHGEAVEPLLEIHRQRERVEDLRDWYRMELPGSADLFTGIQDYLQFHRDLRPTGDAVERRAAA